MKKMAFAVLFAMMAVFSTAVFAEEDPCDKPANLTEIYGVYQIGTCGDLYKFAEMVNGGETGINGKLIADICLNACGEGENVLSSDGTLNGNGFKFIQWTPIGTEEKPYKGTFNGNGHTISGLYFNDENVDYVGLFGFISDMAKVWNVGVVDSYIKGLEYVGGVVGFNARGGTIRYVYNTGTVSGTDSRVGGVVGNNSGTVSNVYNTGAVSGDGWVGGVVGDNGGTVSNVYNTGAVSGEDGVGGVVGENDGNISNVYNTGAVSGRTEVGGVVGVNDYTGTVSNVYNTGTVSGDNIVGGVVGQNLSGSVSNVYNTGAVSGIDRVGGVVGCNKDLVSDAYYNTDFYTGSAVGENGGIVRSAEGKPTAELASTTLPPNLWVAGSGEQPVVSDGKLVYKLPGLIDVGSQPEIEYTGFQPNADGYYEISNAQDLKWFAQLVNSGTTSINGRLTADICLNACGEGESVLKADGTLNGDGSNFTQWTPIGSSSQKFLGTLDGQGHTVSGLYFSDENVYYAGLFGFIDDKAKIQNVGVVDSYIRGRYYVGGVVGYNKGTISNVYNTGAVRGFEYVGGVVGQNAGGVRMVYNAGAVSGDKRIGGVVGYNNGDLSNVYNTGAVSGLGEVGGVVGFNAGGGTVENAYYNTDFYAWSAVGKCDGECEYENVEGKTTAELASTTLPDGFSSEIWVAGSGESFASNGKLMYKLPGLKNVGSQPEMEYTGFQPNAEGFYEISTARELKCFAQLVNSGATSINGRLTADICLNACGEGESVLKADGTLNGDGSNFTQWTPIGTVEKPYEGTFDGNGKRISGLYFSDEDVNYVGLFKYNEGIVQNVGVVDSYIRGRYYVGGVVGCNKGTVSNVYNTGAVSGSDEVGGVVGCNKRTISNVYNTGAVSGWVEVGGVVGFNAGNSTVSNVYNTGAVSGNVKVGGVVGWNIDGTVSNVYNTGAVSGLDEVGGVVGNNGGTVENAYYNTDFYAGNALGENKSGSIENVDGKPTGELIAIDFGSEWVAGNLAYDKTTGKLAFGFPYLKNFGNSQYKITALEFKVVDNVIQIANADDLKDFARLVNEFGVTDVDAELTADICLNACGEGESVLKADGSLNGDGFNFKPWTPILAYDGTFDGNGHTISGLYFNDENVNYVGLLGYIGDDAKAQNVGVVDSYIRGAGTVGGVVGLNAGGTIRNVYNTGVVSGGTYVGGVVGNNGGTVRMVYNTGAVSGLGEVGGVVGNNGGTVSNVYNTG
ncbi:MAG: hypothetical protein MJY78_04650, partial [Fibrobacter sp.]|nr:hypothetical protein [Fibrobacter sp.]